MADATWDAQLGALEDKDFHSSFADEMAGTGDTISTSTWTLSAAAITGGIEKHTETKSDTVGSVWLKVNVANQGDYADPGTTFEISHEILTTAGRKLKRTIGLLVKAR